MLVTAKVGGERKLKALYGGKALLITWGHLTDTVTRRRKKKSLTVDYREGNECA